MPLPTQQPTFAKYYTAYAASLAAAASPSIPVTGRGRVVDIRFTPLVATTTTITLVAPKVNATQMQLNGSNVNLSIAIGLTAITGVASVQPNGLNIVDLGDVIVLTSNAGAANAASVPGYYTVEVDERSI
jgi:hypothetical protein